MRHFGKTWHWMLTLAVVPAAAFGQTSAGAPPPTLNPDVAGISPNASGPVSPATPTKQLEEIVVTSQKRRENARKIPGSIGVIGGSELINHHIQNYEDITRTLPGVSFAANNGPGQDNISIRGVSSTVGNPTVGVYLDEVPIITVQGFVGQSQPRLFDLDRIEVLRGPQGTLYGASSEGGTIRFITTQPDLENYSAYIRTDDSGTVHGGPNTEEQMAINIPLVKDKVALRLVGDFNYTSGYIDTYAPITLQKEKDGTNWEHGGVFRATMKVQIDPDFVITPSFFFQNEHDGDAPTFIESLGTYKQDKYVREWIDDTLYIPSLTMKKNLGFGEVTTVSAYYTRDTDRQADGTYFNSAAIAQFYLDPTYPQYTAQNNSILANVASPVLFNDRFHTLTQEIRLASNPGRLRWVVGAFYSDQQWTHNDYEVAPGFTADFQKIYGYNINDSILGEPGNPGLWDNDLVWHIYDHNEVRQLAGFGQVDFDLLPTLHLSAGERYVWSQETFSEVGAGFFDIGGGGTEGTPYRQAAHFQASTPKFSLTYDVADDATIYSVVARGFRLGGATTPNTNISCVQGLQELGDASAPTTYGPDHLWSYEAGSKALLLDKTLSVNVAGYYINWSRIQQTITIPICGGAFNANVGDAEAYGGEVELRYKPPSVSGLAVGLNAGAEHATITSTTNTSTAAVGENVLFTPAWSATALTDYDFPISPNMQGFVRADYDWVGPSNGSFQSYNPNYRNPAYGVLNASLGFYMGSWTASLYAKNLTDSKIILQQPVINSVVEAYTLRPLTAGIQITKHFF
jgi:outer membrane receptor protein involved in Fe transport